MRLFIPFLFSNTPRCHVFVVFMYGFAPPMYWAASSLLFVSLTDWMSLGVSTQHPSLTRFWCVHSRTQCAPFFGFRSHFGLFTYLIQRTWRYSLSLFRTPLISASCSKNHKFNTRMKLWYRHSTVTHRSIDMMDILCVCTNSPPPSSLPIFFLSNTLVLLGKNTYTHGMSNPYSTFWFGNTYILSVNCSFFWSRSRSLMSSWTPHIATFV